VPIRTERRPHAERQEAQASQDGDAQAQEEAEKDASQEEDPLVENQHPVQAGCSVFMGLSSVDFVA
jgi:hypothetical protein